MVKAQRAVSPKVCCPQLPLLKTVAEVTMFIAHGCVPQEEIINISFHICHHVEFTEITV